MFIKKERIQTPPCVFPPFPRAMTYTFLLLKALSELSAIARA
jgi:hypothetical protein